MKRYFKRILCVMLSAVLLLGTCSVAFASDEDAVTPVIVINGIEKNAIINTDDDSVVFNSSDYQVDLLFTSGFSENFMELFNKENIDKIISGEMSALDIATLLSGYFGYEEDVNKIVNKVISIVTQIMANTDMTDFDIQKILSSIDFESYAKQIEEKITTAYNNTLLLKMNEDGTPAYDNITVRTFEKSLDDYDSDEVDSIAGEIGYGIAEKIGYENTYVFTYDWRIDPSENAALLSSYIDTVKSESGADKVSVISEGYGSTVATTYLSDYEDKAASEVKNFVTVSSAFSGTSLAADFFTGNTVDNYTNITSFSSAYIRYTNDLSDNPITAFSTWLVNYILNLNWEVQGFCTHVKQFINTADDVMKVTGLTGMISDMPGLWALVPVDSYDDATAYMFDGKTENEELKNKLDNFKITQSDIDSVLAKAKEDGININVVALWDIQIVPIGETNDVQSDGYIDTSYASFGATCVPLNNVAEGMDAVQADDTGHDHLSDSFDTLTPNYSYAGIAHYVDASTCALPENTWFIQNMKYGTFSSSSNSMTFLLWLVTSDSERTVWQDVGYQQFMQYNRYINPGKLSSNGVIHSDRNEGKPLMGDVNLDGYVTSIDSRLAMRASAGIDTLEEDTMAFKNADVYNDGVINSADARKILLMFSGLEADLTSGIEFDYKTEQGTFEKSEYSIELRPTYNSITNTLDLSLVLLDAADSYSGNFIVKFDSKLLTYKSVATAKIGDIGDVVAGQSVEYNDRVECGYACSNAISSSECDKDGNIVLATFTFDVKREVSDTVITAGASHFYENGGETYMAPVTLSLNKDFFFMLGDADNNRYITASDARTILRISAKLEAEPDDEMFKRCDVNGDGKITAADARLVLQASANLIASYSDVYVSEVVDNT